MANNHATSPNYDGASRRIAGNYLVIAHGWNDYVAGLPFREEYETADFRWQRNYEMGRAEAAAAAGLGKAPPRIALNRSFRANFLRLSDEQLRLVAAEMQHHEK